MVGRWNQRVGSIFTWTETIHFSSMASPTLVHRGRSRAEWSRCRIRARLICGPPRPWRGKYRARRPLRRQVIAYSSRGTSKMGLWDTSQSSTWPSRARPSLTKPVIGIERRTERRTVPLDWRKIQSMELVGTRHPRESIATTWRGGPTPPMPAGPTMA